MKTYIQRSLKSSNSHESTSKFSAEEIYMAVNGYDENLADYLKFNKGIYLLVFIDG